MKKILGLVLGFVAFLGLVQSVEAKDYFIRKVDVDVILDKNGNAEISEKRTYQFDGTFSWADIRIPVTNVSKVSEFRVMSEGVPLRLETGESNGLFTAKWYHSSTDVTKTFDLQYKLSGVVINQKDTAEYYWKIIDDGWTKRTDEVVVKVKVPFNENKENLYAFGHGPLNGKVRIVDEKNFIFEAKNLPANKFLEVRVLFPAKD